ncbi:outer membrane lipoprotein-sorting protein [Mangrovibacterium sp.]|uniref:outer membrane lipoprotein-sorting protein n=1 Tax=Mangrovibacterium sp. TaxID=1961364 RepID=UPI003562923F
MKRILTLFPLLAACLFIQAQDIDIKEIVKRADEKFRGQSSQGTMSMTIQRSNWSRTIEMKSWTLGTDYSLIYISAPAKERGQVFLKRENEMWNWMPSIERTIKIPPSMMMQSWMGSDFTNDDLVKESSLVKDYTHKLLGTEQLEDYECFKIELIPTEEAAVVWGKILMWITMNDFLWLKAEFYDEDDELINTEILSEIRLMDDRMMPTHLEMIPKDKPGQKTSMVFEQIKFNVDLDESFFSIQNMKRIK